MSSALYMLRTWDGWSPVKLTPILTLVCWMVRNRDRQVRGALTKNTMLHPCRSLKFLKTTARTRIGHKATTRAGTSLSPVLPDFGPLEHEQLCITLAKTALPSDLGWSSRLYDQLTFSLRIVIETFKQSQKLKAARRNRHSGDNSR